MLDRRVRLRPKAAAENYVYGDMGGAVPSVLSVLRQTQGMVWNYTPTVRETRQVNYDTMQPIHTNSGYNNYKNTSNTTISVQGDFYAGSGKEALYMLAIITFLRSVTLMDFGRGSVNSSSPDFAVLGAPPPVLLFSAYGRYMYNDVPVIVKSLSFDFGNDVDFVLVPLDSSQSLGSVTSSVTSPAAGTGNVLTNAANSLKEKAMSSVEAKVKSTINSVSGINLFKTSVSDINSFYSNIRNNGISNKENMVYVPQKLSIALQLEEQPTPNFMSNQFNLNSFKRGELLRKGGFI
ncbi:virion structural protein [Xanthomonas phage XaC1]|nr:virion structural protein [Xanthomonas phage XaC1]